jgi:hypothetical protein
MATKPDIKKQLEAILGYELSEDAVQALQTPSLVIPLVQSVALSTSTSGLTTRRHLFVGLPNSCYVNRLMDVSGFALTASNGQSLFRLSNFICPTDEVFFQPVNVVATPISSTPCFLTVTHSLVNNGADVEITVFAWDANGAAAPNVSFNWRCRVELLFRF